MIFFNEKKLYLPKVENFLKKVLHILVKYLVINLLQKR